MGMNTRWLQRGVVALVAGMLATGALSACGSDDSGGGTTAAGGSGTDVKDVAFFGFGAANSFVQATWDGVQDAAKKEGVNVKFFDPNFDSAKQVSQIQNAIASGEYQAFVVQANDGNAVVPVIREALDAGISVVAEYTPVGSDYGTMKPQVPGMIFVGEPPAQQGAVLGQMTVEGCKGKDPCRVARLGGDPALPLEKARDDAFEAVLAKEPTIELAAKVIGGYTQGEGLKAAQNVLQAHPDIDLMIGASQAISGAQRAVEDAGKKDQVILIGDGGSRQAIKAVKDGDWFATYVNAERSSGEKATETAIAAARGEDVGESFDTRKLQNPVGTKENLGSFEGEYSD